MAQRFAGKLILFLGATLLLTSCGDSLKDPAPSNSTFVIDNVLNSCKPDAQRFKDFLNQDLTQDLECIQKSLEQFHTTVQTQNPNFIQRDDLHRFIKKFFNESADLTRGLDSLYQIYNHFWPQSQENLLAVVHLDEFFDFLKNLNKNIIVINRLLFQQNDLNLITFKENSQFIFKTGLVFADQLKKKYAQNLSISPLDYDSLIKKLTNDLNQRNMEKIKSLLFFKKFLVGGEFGYLKYIEAIDLLNKLPQVLKIAYEASALQKVPDIELADKIAVIKSNLGEIEPLLHQRDGQMFSYLDISELPELLLKLSDHKFNITPFVRSLIVLKESPVIGYSSALNYASLTKILNMALPIVDDMLSFIDIWKLNEQLLQSPLKIHPEDLTPPTASTLAFERFKTITKDYRYFMDDFKARYTKQYYRTMEGYLFILVSEEILTRFFAVYGEILGGTKNQLVLTEKNFLNILKLYYDFVIENELWRNPPSLIAANTYLMADFFGHQSDGDGYISIPEAVEYLMMQMTSMSMEKETTGGLFNNCPFQNDSPPGISVECAQDNYLQVLEENYPENLSALFASFPTQQAKVTYTQFAALFARQCPFSSIHYNKKDVNLINGGLISIDTTILRFDRNKNNLLDRNELDNVYNLMENVLRLRAPKAIANKPKMLKSLFFYLIEKGESPEESQFKFFVYHLKNIIKPKAKRYKKAVGDRLLMAKILALLRNAPKDDPRNIPEDCYSFPYPVSPGYQSTRI